ncbi:hypothetical protein PM082_019461 [Marasmius tenuissimus]|nr:hypothetical protein PM082_019461 [Marasmius tenuissimus]
MPKLAAKLRQSTRPNYSKLDSERSPIANEKGREDRKGVEELEGEGSDVTAMVTERPVLPRCSTSTWPRRRYLSTFSNHSDALRTSQRPQEDPEDCDDDQCSITSSSPSARTRSASICLSSRHSKSSRLLPRIRKALVKPFQDVKDRVHDLQVQTRRKFRRMRLHANSFFGRTLEIALGPWQAIQGCLYGLLLVCLGVAEILFSIVFTILYKTLEVIIKTLLIPVLIVVALANALRCQ